MSTGENCCNYCIAYKLFSLKAFSKLTVHCSWLLHWCIQECKKMCPVVRMGKLCIEVAPTSKVFYIQLACLHNRALYNRLSLIDIRVVSTANYNVVAPCACIEERASNKTILADADLVKTDCLHQRRAVYRMWYLRQEVPLRSHCYHQPAKELGESDYSQVLLKLTHNTTLCIYYRIALFCVHECTLHAVTVST
jgi:hypothetical protein